MFGAACRSRRKVRTETPEENSVLPEELISKMRQARKNLNVTLERSSPAQHVLHIKSLAAGLRIVMKRLSPC
jgi:hypothetical protein